MSDAHGAHKESQADHLYQAVWHLLVQNGLDPRYRVSLVIDGAQFALGTACFGSVATDRLEAIVTGAAARHREQQQDAVSVLSKFTLRGEIRNKLDGSNHNG